MKERRKFVRTYFGDRGGYWLLGKGRKVGVFRLISLSGGGLSFLIDKALKEKKPLEIELMLPPDDKKNSRKSQVVWSKPLRQRKLFMVGAKFVDLSNQEREVISQFVVDRIKAERKKIMGTYF